MAILDVLAQAAPAAGTLLGGPVGGAIGTLASGIIQGVEADKYRKQYESAMKDIPLKDPMEVAQLDAAQRRRAALEAGMDPMTGMQRRSIENAGAQTMSNIVRSGGNNVSSILRGQQAINSGIANVGAQASTRADQLFAMEGMLTKDIADRAYRRQMSDAQIKWQEFASRKEDANRTTMASIGLLPKINVDDNGGVRNADLGIFSKKTSPVVDGASYSAPTTQSLSPGSYRLGTGVPGAPKDSLNYQADLGFSKYSDEIMNLIMQ
jgi:hypothetical protein